MKVGIEATAASFCVSSRGLPGILKKEHSLRAASNEMWVTVHVLNMKCEKHGSILSWMEDGVVSIVKDSDKHLVSIVISEKIS